VSAIAKEPPNNITSPPLGVWDAGSLIIGIVIGASLFRVPGAVLSNVPDPTRGLLLWLAGGLLSLAGALCYCELATAYPRMGGDYVYLTRAYGPAVGFLFGWMRFAVILPANVGAMAFIFAEHAQRLTKFPPAATVALAVGAIIILTALNLGGAAVGKRVQNGLTLSKLAGLALIVAAGVWLLFSPQPSITPQPPAASSANYGLAMIFILYAYGGWSDAAFVAAEVRDPRRNIPRAMLIGLGSITAIYLAVNAAYLAGLGFDGVRNSATPAAELLQRAWGNLGETVISLIVMFSTLGAINGMLYSGSRLTASVADEHRALRWLGGWDGLHGAPVRSLLGIGVVSLLLVWLVGTQSGKAVLQPVLRVFGDESFDWTPGEAGFDTLVTGTAPTFWIFFCLTSAAVPWLRIREPNTERPFRCGIAVTPLLFGATSLYMLWSSLTFARGLALLGLAILAAGAVTYALSTRRSASS
jgi:basic amino acid/polyamine antiporter, APA family